MIISIVGSFEHQAGSNFGFATCRRHPLGMCTLRVCVRRSRNLTANRTNKVSSWLLFKIVDILRHRSIQHVAVIGMGIVTNILIFTSIASAFPWVRKSVFYFPSFNTSATNLT